MFRLGNCIMAAAATLLSAVICSDPEMVFDRASDVALSMVIVFVFVAGGNSMNDYFDRDLDRAAHPSRPIPNGVVRARSALTVAVAMLGGATAMGWLVGMLSFAIVGSSLAIMLSYELLLKSEGLVGNMAISWLTAALFLFGGAAVDGMQLAWILAALAFLVSLGREIIKDVQDIGGDTKTRTTLPMRVGPRNAGAVASIVIAAAVVFSPAPYLLSLVSAWYMPFLAVADTLFIYSAMIHFADPEQGQKAIKLAMIVALIAFLFGGTT